MESRWEPVVPGLCYLRKSSLDSFNLHDVLYKSIGDFAWSSPVTRSGRPTRRKAVWLTDCACKYNYSGLSFSPGIAPKWFARFQAQILSLSGLGISFNCCNVNYYPDGNAGLDWHADDEALFGPVSGPVPILSFSVGATRVFEIKNNSSGEVISLPLRSGDLLYMGSNFQQDFKHRVTFDDSSSPRVNFTWRVIKKHQHHQCG